MKKALICLCILLLFPISVHAEEYRSVEIFDINQGQVVKELGSTNKIQCLAENYIKGIKCVYCKFDPIPKNGFAVRIPLDPPVKARIKNSTKAIDEVFVMFPENESPFLMVFEDNNNMICYNFNGDTNSLLQLLEYEPKK